VEHEIGLIEQAGKGRGVVLCVETEQAQSLALLQGHTQVSADKTFGTGYQDCFHY
jgi:hypothetical protein